MPKVVCGLLAFGAWSFRKILAFNSLLVSVSNRCILFGFSGIIRLGHVFMVFYGFYGFFFFFFFFFFF